MPIASVLFSAGLGTRLRPLTDVVAKPALPLLDVPLGAYALSALTGSCAPVVVNLSHLHAQVRRALAPWAPPDLVNLVVESPRALGTAGTLRALRDRVGPRVLTMNSDELTDLDPRALLETHERLGAPATVALAPVAAGADMSIARDRVTKLIDRRSEPDDPGWLFLGMAVFERRALGLLTGEGPAGLTEALLRPLIERGEVAAHEHAGYALDVGTPDRYLQGSLDLLAGRGPRLPSWPGERARRGAGWVYRGPGSRAPEEALGPGAVLLRGCEVEPGSRVERSIVWPGERVRAGTLLEGSIFALDAPLEAGGRREPL
ncbi:NDP-sugar synthase [soil metagenome]